MGKKRSVVITILGWGQFICSFVILYYAILMPFRYKVILITHIHVNPTWRDFISSPLFSNMVLFILFSLTLFATGLGLLFLKNWARLMSMGTLIIIVVINFLDTFWQNNLYLKMVITLSIIFCFLAIIYLTSPKVKEEFK